MRTIILRAISVIGITDVNEPGDRAGCFPGGGAAHLFRATGSVAPVSAAPPGKIYPAQQKTPHLPVRGSSCLMHGSLWRASCPPPSGPLLRNVQIRSRRICPAPESAHRQTTDKTKGPVFRLSLSFYLMLAVPYSHMGRPHTTIGATAFHF